MSGASNRDIAGTPCLILNRLRQRLWPRKRNNRPEQLCRMRKRRRQQRQAKSVIQPTRRNRKQQRGLEQRKTEGIQRVRRQLKRRAFHKESFMYIDFLCKDLSCQDICNDKKVEP